MKKLSSLFSVKTAFQLCGCLVLLTILSSCENFLKSNETAQDIKEAIAYNNAPEYTILLKSTDNQLSFLSANEKIIKLGYSAQVDFTVNVDDFLFVKLEAVSKSDTSVSRADCVSFEYLEEDAKKGTYKVKITLLKPQGDIQIQPVCYEYPKVVSFSPDTKEPCYANTPIIITFNKPMETESLLSSNNISITCMDALGIKDMSSYFAAPVYDAKKYQLTLKPDGGKIQQFIKSKLVAYMDIDVSLSSNISITENDTKLPLRQTEKTDFTVRYSTSAEQQSPTKFDLLVSPQELTLAKINEAEETYTIQEGSYSDFNNLNDIMAHRVGKYISVYGRFYDSDSGVKSLVVKEKLQRSKNGSDISSTTEWESYEYVLDNYEVDHSGTGYTSFVVSHEIMSNDGLVALKISTYDFCINESEETTYTIIHDAEWDITNLQPYNNSDSSQYSVGPGYSFDRDYYESNLKTIHFSSIVKQGYAATPLKKNIYKDFYLDNEQLVIECEYGNPIQKQEFIYNPTTQAWDCTLNVESINSLPFKVIFSDDIGNTVINSYQFPGLPVISQVISNRVYFTSTTPYSFCGLFYLNEQGEQRGFTLSNSNYGISDSQAEYYCFLRNHNLFGQIADYTINSNTNLTVDENLPKIRIVEPVIMQQTSRNNEYDITVTIGEEAWDTYDIIILQHKSQAYYEPTYEIFEKNSTSLTFKEYTTYLWKKPTDIGIWGLTQNKSSEKTTITFPEASLSELEDPVQYDNRNPVIYSYTNYMNAMYSAWGVPDCYDYITPFYVQEQETAVTDLYYTIGNRDTIYTDAIYKAYSFYPESINASIYYSYDDYNGIKRYCIPVWDLESDEINIHITAVDSNNNVGTYTRNIKFPKVTAFTVEIDEDNSENDEKKYKIRTTERSAAKIRRVGVFYLDTDGVWKPYKDACKNMYDTDGNLLQQSFPDQAVINNYYYTFDNLTFPENAYVKVIITTSTYSPTQSSDVTGTENFGNSEPFYLYTGTASSGAETDYLFDGINEILVGSDQPVYIHTLTTKIPYEECKNWDAAKWEKRHRHIGDAQLTFTPEKQFPKKYFIDTKNIDSGDCYCVIAHFADGHTEKSQVMVK